MEFRMTVMQDLEQLKAVYREIIRDMEERGINIWDDIYPCEFFADDIKKKRLYVLTDGEEILSAFALEDTNDGEQAVTWSEMDVKVLYMERLGVNVKYAGKGIATLMIKKAKEIAKMSGAKYLRLFAADINKPAICLYEKSGFRKADGIYDMVFDDGFVLHGAGYEFFV